MTESLQQWYQIELDRWSEYLKKTLDEGAQILSGQDDDLKWTVDDEGTITYRRISDGKIHRDNDLPAIIDVERRDLYWYQNGRQERHGDKPSHIGFTWDRKADKWGTVDMVLLYRTGDKNRRYGHIDHRDGDKPAVINSTVIRFFKDGEQYRDGDKPSVITADGYKFWMKGNRRYRKHGPSAEDPDGIGNKGSQWFQHGVPIDKPDNLLMPRPR